MKERNNNGAIVYVFVVFNLISLGFGFLINNMLK